MSLFSGADPGLPVGGNPTPRGALTSDLGTLQQTNTQKQKNCISFRVGVGWGRGFLDLPVIIPKIFTKFLS